MQSQIEKSKIVNPNFHSLPLAEHVGDGGEELVGVRKVAVYAGKAYVGNLVGLVEGIHDECSRAA